ncbi:MAG: long-chain-fatty-acid--CoA ligase [Syntrophobacterales bacterium]|jgi:acyl-CoA synthetase (AMP-forming)/AMP-acid ligase II|nr:long-chain-fatty-acid--CoA ligase [Syntrophobacterales bacterium]
MTIGDLLVRNAHKFPDKPAVISEDMTLTFRALNERVNRLADFLINAGLEKGDRVGAVVHNGHQFIEIYFAAAKAGGIFCPYNNHVKNEELRELIQYSSPKFLFLDRDFGAMIAGLKPVLSSVTHYVCLQKPEWPGMEDYGQSIDCRKTEEPRSKISEDDVLSIIFTAGTTGKPKGAMRTHRHLMSDAVASSIDLRVEYDERVLIAFPMYHVAAEDNIVRHYFMPNTICIKKEGGFNPIEILDYISKERITRCHFVPTMIHSLLQIPDIRKFDLSSLKLILYAGSPMPAELLRQALEVFPCGFAQLYGQTESGPFTTVLKPEDHIVNGSAANLNRLASSGKPALNYEIRIVDEDDRDVAVGEVGEIIGKSEAMTIGYWQMPEATAEKLRGGWLRTGDLGKFDEEGFIYIVERKNDMIISGGVNIYPREVEEVLYRHPAISEVSVIGIPDEHWGEVVKAVVVLKNEASATEAELIAFCGECLAGYKKPKTVDFWKELPKSPQGKILKKEIRTYYAAK